jgi:phage terminase large subunit
MPDAAVLESAGLEKRESRKWVVRGAALDLWRDKSREKLMEGPAGTGKTRAIIEKTLAKCVKYPGSRHLWVRKTRAAMTESVLVTFESKVLPPNSPIAMGPQRNQRQSYKVGKAIIVIGGMDNPERTLSTEYDTICFFEATESSENDWEMLHRALRNGVVPYQEAIADCNPGAPSHWLNQRAKRGVMRRLKSKHEDNPLFWDAVLNDWTQLGREYVLGTLENLTGHRKRRMRYGEWVAAEGVVYDEFEFDFHVVDRTKPEYAAGWNAAKKRKAIVGVDWGFTNPGVMSVWGEDYDGRLYLVKEIYRSKRVLSWWVEQAKKLYKEFPTIDVFACDPSEPANIQEFRNHGLPAIEGYNDIESGVDAVKHRLKKSEDGKARIYVLADAGPEDDAVLREKKFPLSTKEEFDNYQFPEEDDKKNPKETPLDRHNHGMDAMRYVVSYVDDVGAFKTEIVDGGIVAVR